MSILSDKSIRARCRTENEIKPLKQLRAEVAEDTAFVTQVKNETDGKENGPILYHLKLEGEARERYSAQDFGMIHPFIPEQVRSVEYALKQPPVGSGHGTQLLTNDLKRKVISYGLSSYGYDIRLTEDIKLFTNVNTGEIDPLRFDEQGCLVDAEIKVTEDGARYVRIPPNSYLLGSTVEYFRIPKDIMVVCLGKSTYARCGAIVNVTPIEPGFEGAVVIEISNSTPLPMRVYIDQGIGQFLFFQGDEACDVSYADRMGKYQFQRGVTLPRA